MSSPEAMTHAIRQQDFDKVAVKLARQGRPAMRPSERIERTVVCTRAFMAAHGWRDDMGAEVGLLLIKQYERGRDDESAARGGIRIFEEHT